MSTAAPVFRPVGGRDLWSAFHRLDLDYDAGGGVEVSAKGIGGARGRPSGEILIESRLGRGVLVEHGTARWASIFRPGRDARP
ncbi:MAG: hypothetical protein ACLP4W_22730 [Mycobacterium sp.]|uniref:hypothetical protein n=1 Tax=Mycobacterium sp. TaxID=1785 RepID=UPI003F9DE0F0